uniref:RNA-directed DNA polymerase from mobile element jockey n=1 Tax=Sipha flava TaxID=143950 RepID=A0A2S2Q917_9HEMI
MGYYQNCRGLRTKLRLFKCNVAVFNYIFICLTETWLTNSFQDTELGLHNYVVFRCDRSSQSSSFSRGGGVLVAIRNDVVHNLLPALINNVEYLFVKFYVNNTAYIVCSVYIPPNSPIPVYESFMSAVQYIINANPGSVFIFSGDFNLPDLSWSNDNFGLIYSSSGPAIHCVPDVLAYNNFFQLNLIPNSNGNFLDLVFSNDSRINIEKSVTGVVPCDPYHPALDIILTFVDDLPSIDSCHKYFNFRKACYPRISVFLSSFNWLETLTTTDIDSATCALYDALHYCVTSFVPLIVFKPSKFPSWFSKNLKNIVFAKKEMHAKYKASRNPVDYNKFSNLRAQYKYYYKKCYKTFLDNTENMLNVNPRLFWDFVRKRRSNNGIPNSVHLNDLSATGPESISSLFSSYFNSVYVPSSASSLPVIPFAYHTLPSDCIFGIEDVENGLAALKNVHSVGPDGLSGTFLYNIRSVLCFPLWLLFRRSMDDGIFPSMLKISSVTPVFKSGDKSNVTNYRPISILSHIAKLFEHLVLQSIQPSVDSVLVDEQYGFRPGRSSTSNLIVFNNFVLEAFENRSQVDVIFTDFVKAFDRVDHAILIDILYKSGFGEPILSWFKSYLSDRVQWVKVLGSKSAVVPVPSGVPQGGHLSPLLFSLFINGITKAVPNCRFLMFADDLKLFRKIESEADCLALQNELDSISLWFSTLGLQFNTNKCKAMSFTRRRLAIDYSYTINGSVIDRVTSNNDLGVLFTADLNFRPHIDSICCRALKSLGFVMRTMNEFKLSGSLKTVYCSLDRSMLEYASVLWDPFVVIDSCHLERVQRRFLSSAAYMLKIVHPPHDYTPVLRALSLTSLADRRVKANLVFLKKLIDGSLNAPSLLVQVNFKVPHRATRSRVPFTVPLHCTNYGKNKPIDRMMRLANEDPSFLSLP